MERKIIVAPHCDDEIIGCFTLIDKGIVTNVIYLDYDEWRKKEAIKYCKDGNVQYIFSNFEQYNKDLIDGKFKNCLLFVPSPEDENPFHKQVSHVTRYYMSRLGYYSIDMRESWVRELPSDVSDSKLVSLQTYYSSQKSLWKNEWKYFLREGVVIEP